MALMSGCCSYNRDTVSYFSSSFACAGSIVSLIDNTSNSIIAYIQNNNSYLNQHNLNRVFCDVHYYSIQDGLNNIYYLSSGLSVMNKLTKVN